MKEHSLTILLSALGMFTFILACAQVALYVFFEGNYLAYAGFQYMVFLFCIYSLINQRRRLLELELLRQESDELQKALIAKKYSFPSGDLASK